MEKARRLHLGARGTLDPEVAWETRSFPELGARGSGVVEHAVDLVVPGG